MTQTDYDSFNAALAVIFQGIEQLKASCSNRRRFTIDGRLVGDIGEIIAVREFDILLDDVSRPRHDARTADGRDVQIKATFQDKLTFGVEPDLYVGLKLSMDGSYDVVFNGPGRYIFEAFSSRKGIGVQLLSFSLAQLSEISAGIPDHERVPSRIAATNLEAIRPGTTAGQ
jgi:hypothetical protein